MRTLYFDDLKGGEVFNTAARTITETDLSLFSMISGDWSPIHCDVEYARNSRFGARIVHGPFGIAIAMGMFSRLAEFNGSVLALLEVKAWTFVAPIFVGDTLTLKIEIGALRLTSSGQTGIVERNMTLTRHDGAVVQTGIATMMISCRP